MKIKRTLKYSKLKLIDRKQYRGIGRPKNSDYKYYNTIPEFLAGLIGEPICINLPYPNIIEEILKIGI